MSALDPTRGHPTKERLETAWRTLREARIDSITDISVGELGRIAAGNPNYSPAECRMASGLLDLRARLLVAEQPDERDAEIARLRIQRDALIAAVLDLSSEPGPRSSGSGVLVPADALQRLRDVVDRLTPPTGSTP